MDKYISREAIIEELEEEIAAGDEFDEKDVLINKGLKIALKDVKRQPAADVQPISQWISVKDRLPEIGKSVLVIVSINAKVNSPLCTDLALEMRIGWLDDNGKWGLQFDSADRDEILYWMPLPEPPQD